MKYTITILPENSKADGRREITGGGENASPVTLLEIIRQDPDITLPAPCNGSGTCGKCLVQVVSPKPDQPKPIEYRLVEAGLLDNGYRLACLLEPAKEMEIYIPAYGKSTGNKERGTLTSQGGVKFEQPYGKQPPLLWQEHLTLPEPTLEDQRPDLERLMEHCGAEHHELTLEELASLPEIIRARQYEVTLLLSRAAHITPSLPTASSAASSASSSASSLTDGTANAAATVNNSSKTDEKKSEGGIVLLEVLPGKSTALLYGLALDIGTTTIALYLIDLVSGKTVDAQSELNRQSTYGADVISRILYSRNSGCRPVQTRVLNQINSMIGGLTARNSITAEDIRLLTVAGNTTMIHFFLGLNPSYIASAPFVPVTTRTLVTGAYEAGVGEQINPRAKVLILPGVSGYVGADTTAAVLASGMWKKKGKSLLIDIGTNGEIVLGDSQGLLACSTAAGPAFEGAKIRFGIGGVAGGINSFACTGGKVHYTTILSEPPVGICGAGIVDITAELLRLRVVDETGRLLPVDELPDDVPDEIRQRCITVSEPVGPDTKLREQTAFVIVPEHEAGTQGSIFITQKDIREVQLAKAAIAAGIATLLEKAELTTADLETLYLAGGFGSYINPKSACSISLLPPDSLHKITVLGNAAGIGAVAAAVSSEMFFECSKVTENTSYVELSSSLEFQNHYISQMAFAPL